MNTIPSWTSALSIAQFCERYGLSRALYFKLRNQGDGPAEIRVGKFIRITAAAADEWEARYTVQPAERQPA